MQVYAIVDMLVYMVNGMGLYPGMHVVLMYGHSVNKTRPVGDSEEIIW